MNQNKLLIVTCGNCLFSEVQAIEYDIISKEQTLLFKDSILFETFEVPRYFFSKNQIIFSFGFMHYLANLINGEIEEHHSLDVSLAFSMKGDIKVESDYKDGKFRFFDDSNNRLGEINHASHQSTYDQLHLTPDNKYLIAVSTSGPTIKFYKMPPLD